MSIIASINKLDKRYGWSLLGFLLADIEIQPFDSPRDKAAITVRSGYFINRRSGVAFSEEDPYACLKKFSFQIIPFVHAVFLIVGGKYIPTARYIFQSHYHL